MRRGPQGGAWRKLALRAKFMLVKCPLAAKVFQLNVADAAPVVPVITGPSLLPKTCDLVPWTALQQDCMSCTSLFSSSSSKGFRRESGLDLQRDPSPKKVASKAIVKTTSHFSCCGNRSSSPDSERRM